MRGKEQPSNPELIQAITDLNAAANGYVDINLLGADTAIDMRNIVGGFRLPGRAAEAFNGVGIAAPRMVTTVNLNVVYSPMAQSFQMETGAVGFDNNHGIAFTPPHEMPPEGVLHGMDLVSPLPSGLTKLERIGPVTTDEMQDFFRWCGIALPIAPEISDFDAIDPYAKEAEHVTRATELQTPYSVDTEMRVTDRISISDALLAGENEIVARSTSVIQTKKSGVQTSPQRSTSKGSGYVRDVSVQLVDYGNDDPLTYEAVLRARNRDTPLQFVGMYEYLPDQDEPKLVMPTVERLQTITDALGNTIFSAENFNL